MIEVSRLTENVVIMKMFYDACQHFLYPIFRMILSGFRVGTVDIMGYFVTHYLYCWLLVTFEFFITGVCFLYNP